MNSTLTKRIISTDSKERIVDSSGRILYFPTEQFISDICMKNNCFICGRSEAVVPFNREHVLPDWIIKKYNLSDRHITLINGTDFRYSNYKVPCCRECNSKMGDLFEDPIRNLFSLDFNEFNKRLFFGDRWQFYKWLSLIFFKTHYKDLQLRLDRDQRAEDLRHGHIYDWKDLHHIHCVARSWYADSQFDRTAWCTLLVLPCIKHEQIEPFDYADLYYSKSILIRLEDKAIIAVLNDSCATQNLFEDELRRFTAPLNPLQVREVFTRLSYLNNKLKVRPEYTSEFNRLTGEHRIPRDFELMS